MNAAEIWLAKNKHRFGTPDNLPGEFDRQTLMTYIRPGKTVGIIKGAIKQIRTGRAVMPSSHGGWVLNMGGRYGTPDLVDVQNVVYVAGANLWPKKKGKSNGNN